MYWFAINNCFAYNIINYKITWKCGEGVWENTYIRKVTL